MRIFTNLKSNILKGGKREYCCMKYLLDRLLCLGFLDYCGLNWNKAIKLGESA